MERSSQNAGAPQVYSQLNAICIPCVANAVGSSGLIALASRTPALLLPTSSTTFLQQHIVGTYLVFVKGMELTKAFTSMCLSSAQHSLSASPVFVI